MVFLDVVGNPLEGENLSPGIVDDVSSAGISAPWLAHGADIHEGFGSGLNSVAVGDLRGSDSFAMDIKMAGTCQIKPTGTLCLVRQRSASSSSRT